jgi:glyoxylase-like metal-dependent hydrolase (beta-lactamase superfamily II)
MGLRVTQFINGKWKENCYVAANDSGDALIIDPGSNADGIMALVDRNHWRVYAILNTHAHYDHVGAVAALQERYQAPFYLHRADESLLKRANLYRMLFESRDAIKIPVITQDISILPAVFELGPFSISWIATPGHTDGSVCLLLGEYLFSGDTLMHDAIGRTDLPGGNREQLLASVRKLMNLPGETVLCGGHGPQSTLQAEFSPGARAWSLLQ